MITGATAPEPPGAAPSPREIEEEIRQLLLRRLRIGAYAALPFIAFYAIGDVVAERPFLGALLLLKLVPLAVCLVAASAPRVPFLRKHPVPLAAGSILALGAVQLTSSILENEVTSLPMMVTSLGVTGAVYLPWGKRTQALVSALLYLFGLAGIAAVLGWAGLRETRALGGLFGMLIVLGNSPIIASTIRSLLIRNRELYAAKDRLAGILEKRLEDANQKLERRGIALEQALEEAEKANLSKTKFLANMSHEFRTPLNLILGFAAMLRNGAAGAVSEKQLDYLSEICTGAEHLLNIVERVLMHARMESEADPLQLSQIPVDLLLEVACRQVTPKALEKEMVIRRSRPSGVYLRGDKQKLLQVMLNLLTNAIKFSPRRGEVGVEASDVGDRVEIRVRDSGIGIDSADVERIFRPFEQVESANRTSQKGTGLGLAISRRLVEAHGGFIRIESSPGAGSLFVVSLPKTCAGVSTSPRGLPESHRAAVEPLRS